ncbi:hypothetical protein ABPG75_002209 [Micractinium tetrahymenae]
MISPLPFQLTGCVERHNRTLKDTISALILAKPEVPSWVTHLWSVQKSVNNMPHAAHGGTMTAAQVLFGALEPAVLLPDPEELLPLMGLNSADGLAELWDMGLGSPAATAAAGDPNLGRSRGGGARSKRTAAAAELAELSDEEAELPDDAQLSDEEEAQAEAEQAQAAGPSTTVVPEAAGPSTAGQRSIVAAAIELAGQLLHLKAVREKATQQHEKNRARISRTRKGKGKQPVQPFTVGEDIVMQPARKGKALFDDDEAQLQEQEVELRVNEDYAKRFEAMPDPCSQPPLFLQHNKKREELQRLQEKYPEQAAKLARKFEAEAARQQQKAAAVAAVAAGESGSDESSSSEDEEEDPENLISQKTQAQIFETLLKIRDKDASIYQPETKFYSSEEEAEEGEGAEDGAGSKKERPMYLKDIVYQQALQEGGTDSDEEEGAGKAPPRTYAQEQQELKKAFLTAFEETEAAAPGEDGFGAGVLKQRAKKGKAAAAAERAAEEDAEDGERGGGGRGGGGGAADAEARVQQLLDGYFGRDEELSKEDRFLKRYILNKGWVDEGDDDFGGEDDNDLHAHDEIVDEDEEELERAEQFEHAYNFRFEEPGAAAIITYPRNVEGTVRKEDDRRKRKRQEKAERLAAEEEQRRAEVRRLKNLKKAEIEEKLQEIQSVAGKAAPRQELLDRLVAGDFDPEEYDKQMAAAFGDDYYDADADLDEDDLADEEFEKELEAMARYGSDDEDPRSFAALHKRLAAQRKADAEAGSHDEDDEGQEEGGEGEGGEGDGEGGGADPEAAARARAEVQRLLEEYFKLDYEDVVGGIPTRFRYKEVQADSFGLSVQDILGMEDRELNQVVGLKKLAPYREEHKRVRPNYGKLNELRKQREEQQGGGGKQGWQRHGQGGGKQGWQRHGQGGGKWQQRQQRDGKHGGGRFGADVANKQQQQDKAGQPAKSAAERRLESFSKPTLKKQPQQQQQGQQQQQQGGGQKKRKCVGGKDGQKPKQQPKQKPQQQQQQPANDGPKLSRAAKRNMRRSEKRAAKRAKVGGGEGGDDAS